MDVTEADRDRVVRELTRHCGDGRLTLDELEERIAEAYAASTADELQHSLRQLPVQPTPTQAPVVQPRPMVDRTKSKSVAPADAVKAAEIALRIHLVVYLSVIGLLTAIWFMTMPFGYFWPAWPAMSWGVAVAIHAGVTKAVVAAHRN